MGQMLYVIFFKNSLYSFWKQRHQKQKSDLTVELHAQGKIYCHVLKLFLHS